MCFAVPSVLIGLALGWYNAARFGNPLDFGFWHGVNPFFATQRLLFSPRFLLANARAYLFTPPSLGPWFPFVFPLDPGPLPALYSNAEAMCGFLPVTVLCCCIAAGAAAAPLPRPVESKAIGPWVWALAGCAIVEGLFTFLLGIRAYRYAAEFLTPVSFLLVLGLARCWRIPGRAGCCARAGILACGVLASLHVLLGSIQLFNQFKNTRPSEYAGLSSIFNPRQSTLERLGAPKPGGADMKIRFSRPATARVVALMTTGLPDAFDALRCIVFPSGHVKFEIYHSGFGGPGTGLIPIDWDRTYSLEVFMGSLFPAANDPFFKAWPGDEVTAVKSLGWLSLDGKVVINRRMQFHESSPWPVYGDRANDAENGVSVQSVESGVEVPKALRVPAHTASALYSLELVLPPARGTRPMPLLSSGVTGNGDLLYFDPLPDGRYRLGIDEWGIGAMFGVAFDPETGKRERVDLVVGPALEHDPLVSALPAAGRTGGLRNRIFVWYGGKLVGDFTVEHHAESFDTLYLGQNDAGFTSALNAFPGEISQIDLSADQQSALLGRALQVAETGSR
jgi:hypothetical protein